MKTPTHPRRRLLQQLCLLAAPGLLPATVFAHGDSHPRQPRELVREQKPWGIAAAPADPHRAGP